MQPDELKKILPARYRRPVLTAAAVLCVALGMRMLVRVTSFAHASFEAREPAVLTGGNDGFTPRTAPVPVILRAARRNPFDTSRVIPPIASVTAPTTAPAASTAPAAPTGRDVALMARAALKLQGAMVTPEPMAIINSRIYRVGDHVEGYVVKDIRPRALVVSREGHDVVITCD